MLKFQSLKDKGKIVFNKNKRWERLALGVAIWILWRVMVVKSCYTNDALLSNNSGHYASRNSIRLRGKLKSNNLFQSVLLFDVISALPCKMWKLGNIRLEVLIKLWRFQYFTSRVSFRCAFLQDEESKLKPIWYTVFKLKIAVLCECSIS